MQLNLFVLGALTSFTSVAAFPDLLARTACNKDNCYRAVAATGTKPGTASALADCTSFMRTTVTPCTVTSTSTSTAYSTVYTATTTVYTNTPNPAKFRRGDVPQIREDTCSPVTASSSVIPSYARSGCMTSTSRYSSACSCLGVTSTVITAPVPTSMTATTTTITVSTISTLLTTSTTDAASTPSSCNSFKASQSGSFYSFTYLSDAAGDPQSVQINNYEAGGKDAGSVYTINENGYISPASNPTLFWAVRPKNQQSQTQDETYQVIELPGTSRATLKCAITTAPLYPAFGSLSCSLPGDSSNLYNQFYAPKVANVCSDTSCEVSTADPLPLLFGRSTAIVGNNNFVYVTIEYTCNTASTIE